MTSCFVYKDIMGLELINERSINSRSSSGVYKLMVYFMIVNNFLRNCHSWLARQYMYSNLGEKGSLSLHSYFVRHVLFSKLSGA